MSQSIYQIDQELRRFNQQIPGIGQKLLEGLCSAQLDLNNPITIRYLEEALNNLRIDTSDLKTYLAQHRNNFYQEINAMTSKYQQPTGETTLVTVNDPINKLHYPIHVPKHSNVANLKQALSQYTGYPLSDIKLIYGSKLLSDDLDVDLLDRPVKLLL